MNINWKSKPTIIYGIPTRNNKRLDKDVEEFIVYKITASMVHTSKGKFYKDTGQQNNRYDNGGYIFFESKEAIEKYNTKLKMIKSIGKMAQYKNNMIDMDYTNISTIYNLMIRRK